MIQVSANYKALAESNTRNIEVKALIGSTFFTSESIIDLNIYRSIGENGLSIGNAVSNHCTVTLATSYRMKSGAQVIPYVRFKGETDSEWLKLGVYFITETKSELNRLKITAYDKMYTLDKLCTYLGTTSGSVPPVSFPCTMQALLNYTCACRGLECDFKCQDFTVNSLPVANPKAWDDSRYYTHRQMLGYIAAAHGANACFDNEGKLIFRTVEGKSEYIEAQDCVEQNIDSEEPFTVNGIRLQVGENYIFINDTGEPYDEDMEGIIENVNPLGSIAVAEYIWKQLGGFSYCSCDFIRRGRGWIEPEDILIINDSANGKQVNVVVGTIELSFSANTGFLEHIVSEAETSVESGNRAVLADSGGNTSYNSDMAVYFSAGSGNPSIGTLSTKVVGVGFSAAEVCIPLFAATVLFEIRTAGTVKFSLIYDGVIINSYNQICDIGKHFVSINMPLVKTGNGGHNANLWVSSEDAKGTIDGLNTYATVSGSGLRTNAAWDGTIYFVQEISDFHLGNAHDFALENFAENINAKTQIPTAAGFAESIGGLSLNINKLELNGFAENVDVQCITNEQRKFTEQITGFTLQNSNFEFGSIIENAAIISMEE